MPKNKVVKVARAKGSLTYKKVSGNKNISVSQKGALKVQKSLRKGTYKIKVAFTPKDTALYVPAPKTVIVTIKVK